MNILLNFFPVSSGGGQQVASNFLKIIAKNDFGHKWFMYVGAGSELHGLAKNLFSENQLLAIPYSYGARLFNRGLLKNYVEKNQISIIYNYAPVLPVYRVPQVVRSVYSNLYFPEIDFWGSYPISVRMKKKVIDYFRLKGTLKANGLMFENRSMQERAISLFKYNECDTVYIEPSVSDFDQTTTSEMFDYLEDIKDFKILYLSSWHLNKNIHMLPHVAKMLSQAGIKVKFILSLDKSNPDIQVLLIDIIDKIGVGGYFEFIGKVKAIHVHQVIKSSNAMILLSRLECFSSNIIEAFTFQRPILLANEKWSKAACGDAAIYVNRDDPKDIAEKIIRLVRNEEVYNHYMKMGSDSLKNYNTPEGKVAKQVEFLEHIYNKSLR